MLGVTWSVMVNLDLAGMFPAADYLRFKDEAPLSMIQMIQIHYPSKQKDQKVLGKSESTVTPVTPVTVNGLPGCSSMFIPSTRFEATDPRAPRYRSLWRSLHLWRLCS